MNETALQAKWRARPVIAMVAGAFLSAVVLGQQVGSGGHSLDRNLQLGSGGYNTGRGVQTTTWSRRTYTPGSSKPLWTVSSSGGMVYSPHNAFNPNSSYT